MSLVILKKNFLFYLFSRYLIYIIQFISSLILSVNLEPFYLGVWGWVLLIFNYFRIIDFGIPNSINILLIRNRDYEYQSHQYIASSFFLVTAYNLLIILFFLIIDFLDIPVYANFNNKLVFYLILITIVLNNYNVLYMNIYRVFNSYLELTFFQSIIPIVVFVIGFFYTRENLLKCLIVSYLFGNLFSFLLFYCRLKISLIQIINLRLLKIITTKGFYLFVYNISFYLIFLSVRSLIGLHYSTEDFGYFTFSFTISNSIQLLFQAVLFIIFPDILEKFKNADVNNIKVLIRKTSLNYNVVAFGAVFVSLVFFPLFLRQLHSYKDTFLSLALTSLAVVLSSSSFSFTTYLMSKNKERELSLVSFLCLIVNVILCLLFIYFLRVGYQYVILSTIITYFLFTSLMVYLTFNHIKAFSFSLEFLNDIFPVGLFLPFIFSICLVLLDLQEYLVFPFFVYLFLNYNILKNIVSKLMSVIKVNNKKNNGEKII